MRTFPVVPLTVTPPEPAFKLIIPAPVVVALKFAPEPGVTLIAVLDVDNVIWPVPEVDAVIFPFTEVNEIVAPLVAASVAEPPDVGVTVHATFVTVLIIAPVPDVDVVISPFALVS